MHIKAIIIANIYINISRELQDINIIILFINIINNLGINRSLNNY